MSALELGGKFPIDNPEQPTSRKMVEVIHPSCNKLDLVILCDSSVVILSCKLDDRKVEIA